MAFCAAKNCAARANQAYGFFVRIRAPLYSAATTASSASDRISAAAPVWAARARSFGLERKVMCDAVASSRGAIPEISIFSSPISWPPRRSTNCPSRVLIAAFSNQMLLLVQGLQDLVGDVDARADEGSFLE